MEAGAGARAGWVLVPCGTEAGTCAGWVLVPCGPEVGLRSELRPVSRLDSMFGVEGRGSEGIVVVRVLVEVEKLSLGMTVAELFEGF